MKQLNAAKRTALRARAHPLKPVVMIGAGGLTPGVLLEIETSLKAHELIKIRVGEPDHAERETMCTAICANAGASPVQHIGKVLVIYRENPKEETRVAIRKPSVKPEKTKDRPTRKSEGRPGSRSGKTRGKQQYGAASESARRPRSTRR